MTPDRSTEVEVTNLETARFECVYPTCGGQCCSNGRPPVEEAEHARIRDNLAKFLPHMRPEARAKVEKEGFVTKRKKEGLYALGVSNGWCVFANEGCILHKVGATEGDRWKYKPWRCIAFPLERSKSGKWHVRQWKLKGEAWDLFCLNPEESDKLPAQTLAGEIEFLKEFEGGSESWRRPAD